MLSSNLLYSCVALSMLRTLNRMSSAALAADIAYASAAIARLSRFRLPSPARRGHAPGMFVVSEADAAAIRDAFEHGGELAAAVELRRLFPGLANNENTRLCARSIASWQPLPVPPVKPRQVNRRRASRPAAA